MAISSAEIIARGKAALDAKAVMQNRLLEIGALNDPATIVDVTADLLKALESAGYVIVLKDDEPPEVTP